MGFIYTDQQWSLISRAIGRDEAKDRESLQSFASHCLECGTPQQVRRYYRYRQNRLEAMSEAFLDFVSTMESLGENDETEFIIKEETPSRFKIGDMRAYGKQLLQHTMVVD